MPHMANLPWIQSYTMITFLLLAILISLTFQSPKKSHMTMNKEIKKINTPWKW